VRFQPETALGRFIAENLGQHGDFPVNSIHRQVVKDLGRGIRVAGMSHDGLIEAIEDSIYPERYFAVQWHPERAPGMQRDDLSRLLFRRFIAAATNRATAGSA
jgi:putative glutamine amidotransferase